MNDFRMDGMGEQREYSTMKTEKQKKNKQRKSKYK